MTLIGLAASVIAIDAYVSYRLSVTSITLFDPSKPFRAQFTISNDGYLPLRNVNLKCTIPLVLYEYNTVASNNIVTQDRIVDEISAGSKITVPCSFDNVFTNPIISADMSLTLSYQPVLLPFRKSKSFRFVTEKDSSGAFHWLEQPN